MPSMFNSRQVAATLAARRATSALGAEESAPAADGGVISPTPIAHNASLLGYIDIVTEPPSGLRKASGWLPPADEPLSCSYFLASTRACRRSSVWKASSRGGSPSRP